MLLGSKMAKHFLTFDSVLGIDVGVLFYMGFLKGYMVLPYFEVCEYNYL